MRTSRCDVFLIHPEESPSALFSPTNPYNDYAISAAASSTGESQSLTREASFTRPAFISITASCGSRVLLLVRERTGAVP